MHCMKSYMSHSHVVVYVSLYHNNLFISFLSIWTPYYLDDLVHR